MLVATARVGLVSPRSTWISLGRYAAALGRPRRDRRMCSRRAGRGADVGGPEPGVSSATVEAAYFIRTDVRRA